jgi:hypothetical protein
MKYEPVKVWLDDVRDRMMQIYSKSNIYGVLYSIYDELGPFGTSAALLVEDFHEIIRGRHYTVGEYYLPSPALTQ